MIKKQKSKSYANRTTKENAFDILTKKHEERRFYELIVGIAVLVALLIFVFYFMSYFNKVSSL
jgi:hypothetical protein